MTASCLYFKDPLLMFLFFLVNVAVWSIARISIDELFTSFKRYTPFFFFITVSYAILGDFDEDFLIGNPFQNAVNFHGIVSGIGMALRVYNIVLSSLIVRKAGNPDDLYRMLRAMKVPDSVALPFEVTSALLEMRFSSGNGSDQKQKSKIVNLSSLLRGNITPLVESMGRSFLNARKIIMERNPFIREVQLNELIVIASLSFLIMSIRMIKILPGIPFAPGHKSLIIIPFYILAHELSSSRWGSTKTGFTVGIISFMMGFGKFGVFELLKHVSPGLFVDLTTPVMRSVFKKGSPLIYCTLGVMISIFRFSTLLVVTLLASPPEGAYYVLVFIFVSHIIIGALSGFITYPLLKSVDGIRLMLREQ